MEHVSEVVRKRLDLIHKVLVFDTDIFPCLPLIKKLETAPFSVTKTCEMISRTMGGVNVTALDVGSMHYNFHVDANTPPDLFLRDLLDNVNARKPIGVLLTLQFADQRVAPVVPAQNAIAVDHPNCRCGIIPAAPDFMTSWLAHQAAESDARAAPRYAGRAWPPPHQQRTGLHLGP